MKKMSVAIMLSTLTLGATLAGCSATKTETKPEASSESSASAAPQAPASAAPSASALPVPELPTGPHKTIADYVNENKIVESQMSIGQAGAPTINFPLPPDWSPAGERKPDWAYGAIVYDKAKDPNDPPFITAIYSKLTGNVDAAKVLEYAPGLLQNLPGYKQDGDVEKGSLSGFDAVQFEASYLRDNVRRYIAQQTVVIPGKDGATYVLQLNADAPEGQDQLILDAAKVIHNDTKITA